MKSTKTFETTVELSVATIGLCTTKSAKMETTSAMTDAMNSVKRSMDTHTQASRLKVEKTDRLKRPIHSFVVTSTKLETMKRVMMETLLMGMAAVVTARHLIQRSRAPRMDVFQIVGTV